MMVEKQNCPTSEELSCFVAGTLEKAARQRVGPHLDGCEHCYAVVVDSMQVLADLEAERADGEGFTEPEKNVDKLVPFPLVTRSWRTWGGLAVAALLMLVFLPKLWVSRSDRGVSSWWRQHYAAGEGDRVKRAQRVFKNVLAAADKRGDPRLEVLDTGGPFALALKDETVILSAAGLRFCYEGVPLLQGDRRVALVLGHELAHLHRGEYHHAFAASRHKANMPGKNLQKKFVDLPQRELAADSLGMLYAMLAGYGPTDLVDSDGSFFLAWSNQPTAEAVFASHPDHSARVEAITAAFQKIGADLERFTFAVRLYDLGRFDTSRHLWEICRQRFPAREIANNIGLTYFQEAAQILAGCNGGAVSRFIWPLAVDRETLAQRSVNRGVQDDFCLTNPDFNKALRLALTHFDQAARRDANHLSPRLNAVAALLLAGKPEEALMRAEDFREQGFQDPRLEQAALLAQYLFLPENRRVAEQVSRGLDLLYRREPGQAALAYNLAEILLERGRSTEAETWWRHLLELAPDGPHGDLARARMGLPVQAKATRLTAEASPVPLGKLSPRTHVQLLSLTDAERFAETQMIHGPDFTVLISDGKVELVKTPTAEGRSSQAVIEAFGKPAFKVDSPAGEVWYYDDLAVEFSAGQSSAFWYFERDQE